MVLFVVGMTAAVLISNALTILARHRAKLSTNLEEWHLGMARFPFRKRVSQEFGGGRSGDYA
jgi:hypothetical protein